MIKEPELPSLTTEQLDMLRHFALLEVGIEELRQSLVGVFEFDSGSKSASGHFRIPEPGIAITREHISNALERRRFELVSERDLAHWATILLMNDAYVFDPGDEDLIADWLNDISLLLGAG